MNSYKKLNLKKIVLFVDEVRLLVQGIDHHMVFLSGVVDAAVALEQAAVIPDPVFRTHYKVVQVFRVFHSQAYVFTKGIFFVFFR